LIGPFVVSLLLCVSGAICALRVFVHDDGDSQLGRFAMTLLSLSKRGALWGFAWVVLVGCMQIGMRGVAAPRFFRTRIVLERVTLTIAAIIVLSVCFMVTALVEHLFMRALTPR
jgi:hypothetical protein